MGEMMNRFEWWSGSPRERADMIRRHYGGLSSEKVCDLFELTPEGLDTIARGADWSPEFERPAINYLEDGHG